MYISINFATQNSFRQGKKKRTYLPMADGEKKIWKMYVGAQNVQIISILMDV